MLLSVFCFILSFNVHLGKGLRYGKVMYDCELSIDEWVGFFCRKKCGATLYRLRDDIIFAEDVR